MRAGGKRGDWLRFQCLLETVPVLLGPVKGAEGTRSQKGDEMEDREGRAGGLRGGGGADGARGTGVISGRPTGTRKGFGRK
jgi:hypothetical protein